MATKKKSAKSDKTFFEKIGDTASHLKDELISGKDHVVEAVGNKIASVKKTIKKYQARKKKPAKKHVRKTTKSTIRKAPKTQKTKRTTKRKARSTNSKRKRAVR